LGSSRQSPKALPHPQPPAHAVKFHKTDDMIEKVNYPSSTEAIEQSLPRLADGQPLSQPQGIPMMTVDGAGTGGNRNSLNKPLKSSGQRDWSFGMFDCFSACGTCCFAWWCPCLAYGKHTSRLLHLNTQGTIHPAGGDMVCLDQSSRRLRIFNLLSNFVIFAAFGLTSCYSNLQFNVECLTYARCPCIVHMGLRRDIRQRYNIEGSCGSDLYVLSLIPIVIPLHIHLTLTRPHSEFLAFFLDSWSTWCCVPCAFTQESREIELEEKILNGGRNA
jgi:Cys-rich protein (TIGR01571 family)